MADRREKSPEDCYYFLYSTCRKGEECEYRHNVESKANPVLCERWSQAKTCTQDCPFRHSYHHLKKRRSDGQCYWEAQEGGCTKKFCEFRHRDPQRDAWKDGSAKTPDAQYKSVEDASDEWNDERPKRRMWQDGSPVGAAHNSGNAYGHGGESRGGYGFNGDSRTQANNTAQLNGNRWFKPRNIPPDGASLGWAAGEQHANQNATALQEHHSVLDIVETDADPGIRQADPSAGSYHAAKGQYSRRHDDDGGPGLIGPAHENPRNRGSARQPASSKHGARQTDEMDEDPLDEELKELDDLLRELEHFLASEAFSPR